MRSNTSAAGPVRINPANGSEVSVEAGQSVTLAFDVSNESPEIVSYSITTEQVPAEWIADAPTQDTAPGTNDRVRVVLRPFVNAMDGVYPVRLSIAADGSVLSIVSLNLRVYPAPTPVAPPPIIVAPPPVQETPVARVEVPEPAPPPVRERPPVPAPTPDPVPAPVPQTPTQPTPPVPQRETTPVPPAPRPPVPATPGPVVTSTPVVAPPPVTPRPPAPRPPVVTAPVIHPPVAQPEPLPVTDEYTNYSYQPDTQETVTDEPEERNIVVTGSKESGDGEVFTVAPGQTLLVRLTVQNDGVYARNYVLEDDQLLDVNWLDLRQYDINLDRNAVGELRFRLTPPTSAEPGAYPFGVRFGPSDAARRIRQFTLLIPALPAVRISSEQSTVIRPFGTGHESEFALNVESTGNANTAFRVGVVAADGTQPSINPDTPFLYETGRWRYLFDRELEEVRVPENRQPARPETIKLRLARKGIWWLGWAEKHQVTVAATPVMTAQTPDMQKADAIPISQTSLTLRRWRILPFPAFVVIPLFLLLLPLLGGGARDVVVENGVQGTSVAATDSTPDKNAPSSENLYYVLQNDTVTVDPAKPAKKMAANLQWSAPAGTWLSLWTDKSKTLAAGPFLRSYTDTQSVPEYGVTRTYTVGSLWSRQSVTVRYLPLRTSSLKIVVKQGTKIIPPKVFDAPEGNAGGGREYILAKSGPPASVSLTNGYTNGLDVIVWMATNTGNATVSGIATVDAKRLLPQTTLPPITLGPPSSGSAEVVLLTTDAKAQVVRLRFE